ncbi:MAG: PLP-dependent aspartate aminotransferase family protein [Pyrinomonadaceae bacterium]
MPFDEQDKKTKSLATIAVHGGALPEIDAFRAVVAPVYHSTIYDFESFAEMRRYAMGELPDSYFYSRYANPTVAETERKIAQLEGAESCIVTSSGSAAIFAALGALCETGDEIIACETIYGGTIRIITDLLGRFGVTARFISIEDIARLPELASERTRVFWFETPTNPVNRIIDLNVAVKAAREAKLFSIVDNTFATPVLQCPLAHGVDAVVHSGTKYFGGHSDVTAGAVVGNSDFITRVRRLAMLTGANLDPGAAYLLARGMKTLELRVRAACRNAQALAEALRGHKKIARVYYPGLEENPDYDLAQRQMCGFGGIVAADLAGGEAEIERFFDGLRLIRSATSLGGVETIASYPFFSSHHGFSAAQLQAAGVSASTVRFAVGIEAADDLINDVIRALEEV